MNTPRTLREQVLDKIGRGDVHMHSRLYFILRLILTGGVAVFVFLLSALIASFILFSLHESGEAFLLGFGSRGILTFLALFPWALFVVDVIAILVLRFLIGGFRIIYRFSFTTMLSVLIALSVGFAFLINLTSLHTDLRERADNDDLPLVAPLYQRISIPQEEQGEFRGTIVRIEGRIITIEHDDNDHDYDDGVRRVLVPASIDPAQFSIGDVLYVAGEYEDGLIEAYGIERLSTGSLED